MMLRNHGILTTGRTVPEAFLRLYRLERACQIQVDAGGAGTLNILGDNLAGQVGRRHGPLLGEGIGRPRRPRIRRPHPQARQGRHELAALTHGAGHDNTVIPSVARTLRAWSLATLGMTAITSYKARSASRSAP